MSIRSYVKIKPISEKGAFTDGFNELRKGINRTGAVTESIGKNYVETHKLIKFEKEWLSDKQETDIDTANLEDKDDKKKHRGFLSRFVRMFRRNRRKETENAAEEGEKDADKDVDKKKKEAKGPMKSFLGMITGFLTPIFKFFLAMGVLDWLSKSPEKAQKVFKAIFAIAKFGWAVVGFGINKVMDGLTNLFGKGFDEGPIKRTFRFMGGFLQLASGIAALRFASYMVMPWKLITDVNRLRSVFGAQADQQGEAEAQAAWRKKGYKDRKTGVIYTEKEYKTMRKSARRAGKDNAFQQRVGPTVKQRGRNVKAGALKKWRKGKGIIGKKMKGIGGKLSSPGMMKGVAVLGGVSRIATGIQSGEDATEAVGAGIGQAAGGMLGAAAGTALLGPFLGPFAPIVGNAIGSFLGEWVGKTFLPLIKPLFEPIQKMFGMWMGLIKQVAEETGITEFLGTFFKFVGEIGKVLFNIIGWIMKPIQWLLGGALKVLGGVISFIIKAAKNIFAFMINPIGFAWKVIRRKDPGKDVKLEEFGDGGEMVITKGKPARKLQSFAGGGPTRISLTNEDIEPPQFVYSHQRFTSKITEYVKNGELVELKKEKEFYEVMGSIYYHILMKHNDDILGKLISMKLLKPHHTIRDVVEGSAANHIKPEILYPIFKQSKAQKLSDEESRERTKAFYKRHNLEIGESWVADNFAKGGEVKTKPIKSVYKVPQLAMGGNVPDLGDIEAMTETRDMQLKEFQYKNERDTDMENLVLPPRIVTIQSTVPIINNIAAGNRATPIYSTPSPLFTC